MNVAVVTVGDELLAGRTTDTNATWLCSELDDRGVTVGRVTTVPDRVADIARVVNEYRAEYDAVIVTGGLGPTHDDLTMDGVAAALGREVEEHDAALAWLEEDGYTRDDLAAGTADLPAGARALHNDAGVAPGAALEGVYVLPGVPAEMKAMFESIADEFAGTPTYRETVVAGEAESALLDRIADVRERFDVSVGSYPGESVRIELTGTDEATVADAADWLRERVDSP
ncbi:molybdopterin binding domain protein [Natrinema pellirubrum DSM 15624]|uniref:Molybdenum cofactor synthesis domain protein n=1 Tax=Natrinema pellirubrum (strain DSM 15624 / CIP 106293 / JCM 10476 / NCIMB 786 / 157) TaxID=797303 RepID=L0JQM6_NATP1|nr:molybdopterin-binding protein [Natrinema pellirubrum]AGB32686.1 molybdenum cofactor synthesis domain protein [Natrinema pellirubrum DSM 15624]ELY73820.1 molybdopterin binding domain protein [Natrinema pellirubrum DSM 15624]ELZ12926.1 molybdopterin binding domain protein [Natrinema thermotolerans DSM 11552]